MLFYDGQNEKNDLSVIFKGNKKISILKKLFVNMSKFEISQILETFDKYNFVTYMGEEIVIYNNKEVEQLYVFCEKKEGIVEIVKLFLSNLYFNVEV